MFCFVLCIKGFFKHFRLFEMCPILIDPVDIMISYNDMPIFLYIQVLLIHCNSESKTQTCVREVLVCGPHILFV